MEVVRRLCLLFFFFSSRRRHTRCSRDWSSDVCSYDHGRDVSYTHIFNGHYENLDHILVSQEFYERNPQRLAEVMNLRYFRSEEHRVGKEGRYRWSPDHVKKKVNNKLDRLL